MGSPAATRREGYDERRVARALTWAYIHRCFQEKAAGRLPSFNGPDDAEESKNDRTAEREYSR